MWMYLYVPAREEMAKHICNANPSYIIGWKLGHTIEEPEDSMRQMLNREHLHASTSPSNRIWETELWRLENVLPMLRALKHRHES